MAFRNRNRAVTASAAIISPSDPDAIRRVAQARMAWQRTSWSFYRSLAEIHYPANFIGASLARFTLHVGEVPSDDPNGQPVVQTKQSKKSDLYRQAEDVLAQLEGPGGGHGAILRRFGLNMTLAADCWLYGRDQNSTETSWELLSVDELQEQPSGQVLRYVSYGAVPEVLPTSGSSLLRFWRGHPEYSMMADGALEPLEKDCERLLALNQSLTSRLLSRLSQAGILFLPNTLSIPGAVGQPDGTGDGPSDPFFAKMLDTLERALRDRGTAAASIPIIVRGPSGEAEHIRHITLDRAIDDTEIALRSELRSNIATGMDLPPETQTGLSGASHWASWGVMDSTVRSHLIPLADEFAEGASRVFLRPGLAQLNPTVDPRELRRFVIVADSSNVVARPNEAEDGRQLHDRMAVSDAALRSLSGIPETDAPSEIEYVQQVGRKLNDPYLALYGLPEMAKIDWSMVSSRRVGSPGIGSVPTGDRPAAPGEPVGAPGQGSGAGGVSKTGPTTGPATGPQSNGKAPTVPSTP